MTYMCDLELIDGMCTSLNLRMRTTSVTQQLVRWFKWLLSQLLRVDVESLCDQDIFYYYLRDEGKDLRHI